MKDQIKKLIQFLIFLSIVLLPFITMTSTLGMETFLDSFENPDAYLCLKDSDKITGIDTSDESFIIIQRKAHPDFEIHETDTVLYCKIDGEISCSKIFEINGVGTYTRYYTKSTSSSKEGPIFKSQIIGKVIKVVDNNIWSGLSLKIWEISINSLNIRG